MFPSGRYAVKAGHGRYKYRTFSATSEIFCNFAQLNVYGTKLTRTDNAHTGHHHSNRRIFVHRQELFRQAYREGIRLHVPGFRGIIQRRDPVCHRTFHDRRRQCGRRGGAGAGSSRDRPPFRAGRRRMQDIHGRQVHREGDQKPGSIQKGQPDISPGTGQGVRGSSRTRSSRSS